MHSQQLQNHLLSGNKCTPDCDFVTLYAEKLFLVFCAPMTGHRKCDTCRQTKICNTINTREGHFKPNTCTHSEMTASPLFMVDHI